jgi:predicted transcriptional regulator
MFEALFGSAGAEKVLCYIENYEEGYASEIARTFEVSLVSVQNQLQKFENAGV